MYLGIDVGTTATKAILLDDRLGRVAAGSTVYTLDQPRPGISESDPFVWIDAVRTVLTQIRREAPQALAATRAIGLSGQMHSIVVVGSDDRPLRPAILWNDGRGEAEARRLVEDLPELGEATGVLPMPSFSAAKLLWLRNNAPQDFAAMRRLVWAKDFVRHWLTGEWASDMSDAAGGQLLDEAGRHWCEPLLDYLELRLAVLPRLLEGPAVSGRLGAALAGELGLPAGIPVAAGGGDAATGALGLGCVDEGQAFISLGTGAVILSADAQYRPAPQSLLHAFAHCIPQRWYRMAAMLNGASCLAFVAQLTQTPSVDALLQGAAPLGLTPGRVFFQPYLRGERTPHNDVRARGAFVGLDAADGPQDLTRAVLEGVAFSLRQGWELLHDGSGVCPAAIRLTGGGARSPQWCALIATILGEPVHLVGNADFAGASGAARLGAMAAGESLSRCSVPPTTERVIDPDPAHASAYDERYARYLQLYPALKAFGD